MRRRVKARPTGRPVLPISIEVDPESVLVKADGRVTDAHIVSYSRKDVSRMRDGYVCIQCKEDLDVPFPDECPVCKFPMRDRQSEVFSKEFQGESWVGPKTSLVEELAIAQEMYEREEREKDERKLASQILLPGRDF